MKHGKKYQDSVKLIDHLNQYDPDQATELVISTGKAKFDETVEAHIRLGVDPRHADQQVRGAVVLPHGTGRFCNILSLILLDNSVVSRISKSWLPLDLDFQIWRAASAFI